MLLASRGEAVVRPRSGRLASARETTRLRGVSPDGRHRGGPHQRALRAVVLEESVRWTRGTQTFTLPIRIEAIFATLVQMNADGITMLLVEQNVSAALAIADYVYVPRDGSIVTKGTATALQPGETLQQAYLGSNVSVRENS